ncbi:MAG: bestrophin family protein [Saprospiraceae bacterium]|nr:bestrophin family protein [Saprospiraceae bacterium]MDP4812434.1 bestrophin family protein [Saprospiraceae bacterium]MDP4814686.1 bestrophin family protein [Saprospiraceae bacterium]MDP4913626.1 bestrophin family protein [Saprospiraceae bacterium]
MISYNAKDWFTFIFKIHKAETMKRLLPLLLGVGLYAGSWAYIENVFFAENKTIELLKDIGIVYTILGFTLSLFLVFRTNTAYDRWWEGRRLWGDLTNAIRSICIHLHSSLPIENEKRRAYYGALMHLFSISLKQHLQDKRLHTNHFEIFEENNPIFEDKTSILNSNHQPQIIVKILLLALKADVRHGLFSIHDLELYRMEINKLMDVTGGCERIKNTPIPFTYSVFIKKFIFIYVMLFPIVYSIQLFFIIIPVTMFILYVLASIELIAEEIENPFNGDESDLPLDAIVKNIGKSTREIFFG